MFALEISFQDGVSQPETIFIRRPQGLIGYSDYAHVVVEDMKSLGYQLRLIRDLGRKFRCKPVGAADNSSVPQLLDGSYDGEASIELGPVHLYVTALDFDLLLKESEPPDRAGVRVLRQSCSYECPRFPAVLVQGTPPIVVSFVPDQPIYIGRSKQCALRLDAADISARHARMGYESGEFWIEDLGSTNGTFVNHQQISGRVTIAPGTPVVLGRDVTAFGVINTEQIESVVSHKGTGALQTLAPENKYPILVSMSEVARPARVVLSPGSVVTIGRDPDCEMWLGAPHVSRKHCIANMSKTGSLSIQDSSTNGTAYDKGILKKGEVLPLSGESQVLDFGGGVTVAVCFTEQHEKQFRDAGGAAWAFKGKSSPQVDQSSPLGVRLSSSFAMNAQATERVQDDSAPHVVWWRQLTEYYSTLTVAAKLLAVVVFVLLTVLSVVLTNLFYGVLT